MQWEALLVETEDESHFKNHTEYESTETDTYERIHKATDRHQLQTFEQNFRLQITRRRDEIRKQIQEPFLKLILLTIYLFLSPLITGHNLSIYSRPKELQNYR